jgi:hypothetical protein
MFQSKSIDVPVLGLIENRTSLDVETPKAGHKSRTGKTLWGQEERLSID